MEERKWIIKTVSTPGGDELLNCLIGETDAGFEFMNSKDGPLSHAPPGPIDTRQFPEFPLPKHVWSIDLSTLAPGPDGKLYGSYKGFGSTADGSPTSGGVLEEDGSWTADAVIKTEEKYESATGANA